MRLSLSFVLLATVCALSACDNFGNRNAEPQSASLTRNLTLIGADGNRYGTVQLDPLTGGRMYDTQGRLIGTVITPAPNTGPVATTPGTAAY